MPGLSPMRKGCGGMIRSSELEQAADDGASNQKVAEILREGFPERRIHCRRAPHIHPDHSLSLALERMGASGLNVLPVVSRANMRQLIGIIALDDILDAYGVAKRVRLYGAKRLMAIPFAGRSFLGTFGLVCLAMAALFAADMFLAKMERVESQVEAARLFEQGRALDAAWRERGGDRTDQRRDCD